MVIGGDQINIAVVSKPRFLKLAITMPWLLGEVVQITLTQVGTDFRFDGPVLSGPRTIIGPP